MGDDPDACGAAGGRSIGPGDAAARALAEDPQRRYASAQRLADNRTLSAQRAISVHPSRRYRARKFVARHRLALVLGGAALPP